MKPLNREEKKHLFILLLVWGIWLSLVFIMLKFGKNDGSAEFFVVFTSFIPALWTGYGAMKLCQAAKATQAVAQEIDENGVELTGIETI